MAEQLTAIISIIIIDLVLSGDNAVVIGMAARSLSPENRRRAIIFGGAGAIGLRILFTAMATILLGIPYLQAIGGVLLVYIAFKLLRPHGAHGDIKEAGSLREAIQTIVLADVVMSLDNILAVAGAAHGDIRLLMFGLVLSIPILLFGSELVARLLGRFPAFLYLGAFVLVHAAVAMVLHDATFEDRIHTEMWQELALSLAITAAIVGLVRLLDRSQSARGIRVAPTGADPHG
ncbi:MAG TPA: TerC family protein [Thermomicrobiales bacterium]|nr:TerC family protein [Thermomicrobiales bacterium]